MSPMIRANTAVQNLPTDQLLDLLQGDREFRTQLNHAKEFKNLEKTLEGWVDEFKKQKGLDQPTKAWKLDVGLKLGLPPSLNINFRKELEATQKKSVFSKLRKNQKDQEVSPEALLNKATQKTVGERIWGEVTPSMIQAELSKRGIETQNPRETVQGQQTLLIRDHDLKPLPNSQGYHSIRSGIADILREKDPRQSNIKRIDIQTSKPVTLPTSIYWNHSNLYSSAPLQAESLHLQDLDVKGLKADNITARTLNVNGDLVAKEVKTNGLTGVNGKTEVTQWKGESFVSAKNAEIRSFEGENIQVSGNLNSLRGQVKKLSIRGNLSVSGPLKIIQEANITGKTHVGKLTTFKKTKLTGDSLLQRVAKSQSQPLTPTPKQGHKL